MNERNCTTYQDDLLGLIEEALEPSAEAELREHLEHCPACAEEYRWLRAACTDLDCLAKEIDGAAEKYLKAGTASAHFWDLGKESTSPRVRIEVYTATDPAGGATLLDAVSGKSIKTGFGEKGNSGAGPLAWEEFALGGRLVRVSALDSAFTAGRVKAVCTALEKLFAPPAQQQKQK